MIQSPLLDKKFVSNIQVHVKDDGSIVMENDGNGIDVAKHPEYDIYIPEMIFSHLRTLEYDKLRKKLLVVKTVLDLNYFDLVFIWFS